MRVFITGGSGFIGSHLSEHLLARGDAVMVIDNFATGRHDNLEPHDSLTLIEGDITNRDLVHDCVTKFEPDVVVHAAASYKDPADWYGDAQTNVVGTVNVVQAAQSTGCPRLIYFQTALCYGLHPDQLPITLDHPIRAGDSSYAISKTAGEQYIRLSDLSWVSFRLANAYGPRNLSGPLPTFYQRLTAEKPCFVMDTRRDFIFIDDLIDCVIRSVDGAGEGVYHISSGTDIAIADLFEQVVHALGIEFAQPAEVRPRGEDDAYTILLDPSRTKDELDWQATTPLSEGVRQAVDYYQRYGIVETFTHLKMPRDTEE